MFKLRLSSLAPLLLLLMILLPHPAVAQPEESTLEVTEKITTAAADSTDNTSSTVLLPVLGYTPDTGVMLGGTVLRFFYLEPEFPEARPSVFSPVFIYTLKNQIMVFMGLGLNWDQNRNELGLVPKYIKFPNQFYGLGRDASVDNEEDYTSEEIGLDLDYQRKVWSQWRLGLSSRLMKHRLNEIDPEGQLASGQILGTENSWYCALGPSLSWDSRDNTWATHKGLWLQAIARFGGSALGSDYSNQEYTLDLRGYHSLSKNLVVAGQFLTTRIEGDDPFFLLPRLGGDSGLRGYRGGLYLDKTRTMGRFELRRSGIWKGLGAVAFAGMGDVAPSPEKLSLAGELWSAGFGFRYLLDEQERVNVRVDFGFGNGDSGFYLSLGEAF